MGAIDVADRHHLIVAELVGGIEEIVHAASSVDHAGAERVVGAEDAGGGEGGQAARDEEAAAIR